LKAKKAVGGRWYGALLFVVANSLSFAFNHPLAVPSRPKGGGERGDKEAAEDVDDEEGEECALLVAFLLLRGAAFGPALLATLGQFNPTPKGRRTEKKREEQKGNKTIVAVVVVVACRMFLLVVSVTHHRHRRFTARLLRRQWEPQRRQQEPPQHRLQHRPKDQHHLQRQPRRQQQRQDPCRTSRHSQTTSQHRGSAE
jgi:hypothetical protein